MPQSARTSAGGRQAAFVRVYARALSTTLQSQSAAQAEAAQAALQALADAVGRGELEQWLAAPGCTRAARAQRLTAHLGNDLPEVVKQLLQLLAEHGRLASLPALSAALDEEMRRQQGQLRASVVCASAPAQDAQQLLREQLESHFLPQGTKGASLQLQFEINPELLGGFVARCGDRFIDASLAGRLQRLRQAVTAA